MALMYNYPFLTNLGDVNVGLQANGIQANGATAPTGIPRHLSIVNGAMRSFIATSDTLTAGGRRSECYFPPSAVSDENWYSWDLLVNSADWDSNGLCSVAQIHNKDSIAAAVNFLLILKNNLLNVYIPATTPPSTGTGYTTIAAVPFTFGVWNTCVLHTLWKAGSTGFVEFYVNSKLVYKNWAIGTAYTSDAPYAKLGIYDCFTGNDFGTKTAYYRNVKIYSGTDGYETVLGGIPNPPLSYQYP